MNKRDRGVGGADETLQNVRGNYKSLKKGDKSDDCGKKTSLYIACLVLFIIPKDVMLDVV